VTANGGAADPVPLVLCPGLLCDERLFRHQTVGLADIAAISVADLTRDESIVAMADRVLAEAPERFVLAGLSMGGYVAQEILRKAPDRVIGLILLDTSARTDTPEQARRRSGLIDLARRGRFRGVTPQLLPLLIHPDRLEDEALAAEVMAMAESVGRDAFLRQQTAIQGRKDGREDLLRIACPTLVICGREDRLTPLEVNLELADGIPGADLVVLGRCGHLSTMERPHRVTGFVRTWFRSAL